MRLHCKLQSDPAWSGEKYAFSHVALELEAPLGFQCKGELPANCVAFIAMPWVYISRRQASCNPLSRAHIIVPNMGIPRRTSDYSAL